MSSVGKIIATLLSLTALSCVGFGLYSAARSPMFLVQVIEVASNKDDGPVDPQAITELAAVPVGKVNLFELDLAAVEKRILSNSWIREVRLQKQFPQTLSINVTFREPRALLQEPGGGLAYVDADGKIFGRVNLLTQANLPVLSGFASGPRISEALRLIRSWDSSPVSPYSQISSLSWDDEHGFRALVFYTMPQKTRARAIVDFGHDLDPSPGLETQFHRLAQVFSYLSAKSIAADQIWADSGKKIVVRTVRGS